MLILASASPRRKEILSKYFDNFVIDVADIDERNLNLPPNLMSADLSKRKAYAIFNRHPKDIVIACDTIVVFKGQIFNKPKNEQDAKRMLLSLSNNHHVVLTSYTIIAPDIEISNTVRSDVYFNKLSDELIDDYIKTGSPMDKAGAYGVQDQNFNLIKRIDGSFYNVKGMPIEQIIKDLKRFKLI